MIPFLVQLTMLGEFGARVRDELAGAGLWALGALLAIAVVAAGWVAARLAAALLRATLRAIRFNQGMLRLFGGSGSDPYEPAALAAWALHWTIVVIAVILAADLLGFDLSQSLSARLRDVLPRVAAAALVLAVGTALAMVLGAATRRAFESAGFRSSAVRGRVVMITLSGFAILLGLEQLGLAAQLIVALSVTAVAAVGLALALAFGLGCRELARDFLVEMLKSLDDDRPRRPDGP